MQAALVILDGWGLANHDGRNAIAAAATPTFDRIKATGAFGTLTADGRSVGLPDDQMGNSEVGHLTIGAGRVVEQPYTRINDAIAADELCQNEAVAGAFDAAARAGGRVHFAGLVSDGGVHSDQAHLHALIECAAERGIEAVTHAFTDGRDTSPTGGESYLGELAAVAERHGTGHVATVSGRYYAMDRDENWERTKRAYDAIVNREADHRAPSAVDAVTASYDRGDTDEFVEPTLVAERPALADGDAAFLINFRADRVRQLVRMLADVEPDWEFETTPPDSHLATMTEYDQTYQFPVAFPPIDPTDTLGSVLAEAGRTQLRIAESEKYPHVTYFLNGGREVKFEGEIRRILESPAVPTYDQQPEMSAAAVTETAISIIEREDPDVMVLNYANPDMVGHTGDYEAAIAAVEAVDEQLARLLDSIGAAGAHAVVTADHGNADDMGTPEDPHTAHTFNPVPCIYLAPDGTDGGMRVRDGGELTDLAPTILSLIGVPIPDVMTGTSLLESY
ncbi:2,3-bisphosphoglycerate-independent phosphoglycerate mutase [Halanaeroarchaeum sulfurireducens]|uniref:2,3-bisphosphoglycerate-independent phosphoglycerate mutase n=1 Tax=Halanaeroarchaeum sulfurireducens TaxID=1604004 RepID=A0A0F7PCH4_9EURY|nr:2,3-bisphosphoglycerate-independent phosphoglycerate mutase [Halanaeroarchaeum sulfurireducens]AKH98397.1 phosphoglycerate mutase (2,3-diphosphoglycerate-independent) [Halanaeroarchaeum sulfurireducens]ALG82791.1 phosphoglycerate mutase (2,3-diphosphoglycerate-independent) [Halanaeroarchaeum sulfurireducens]